MTVLDAIPTALSVAEAAILTALGAHGAAYWGALPPDTADPFTRPNTGATQPTRRYIAQHQDRGGRPNPFIGARFWEGLVVVKCFAISWEAADAGLALAHGAMEGLTSPSGYSLSARVDRPIDLPRETTPARALQYIVIVRRLS